MKRCKVPKREHPYQAFKHEKLEERIEEKPQSWNFESTSKEESPDLDAEQEQANRRKILRGLLNDDFITEQKKGNAQKVKKEMRAQLKDGDVIRKKAQRDLMHGTDCTCCAPYYDALGLSPESRAKRVQQVSKHKYVNVPLPKTPEHYWEVGFPSESEQKRRGLIKYASPQKKDSAKKKIIF